MAWGRGAPDPPGGRCEACDEAGFVSRLRRHHICLCYAMRRARLGSVPAQSIPAEKAGYRSPRRAARQPGFGHDQRHCHLPPPAQEPAGEGPVCCLEGHGVATSSTWGVTAATGERKSEDNANEAAQGYRQPNRDEADDLAPARGIAVSVLVGIALWLAIVAVVLLITWFFWDSA